MERVQRIMEKYLLANSSEKRGFSELWKSTCWLLHQKRKAGAFPRFAGTYRTAKADSGWHNYYFCDSGRGLTFEFQVSEYAFVHRKGTRAIADAGGVSETQSRSLDSDRRWQVATDRLGWLCETRHTINPLKDAKDRA